jgi:hypothetical protein
VEGAYAKLMALSMKDGDGQLDNYITEFETLLQKVRWERNMQGAVDLFKQGLKLNLHCRILCYKTLPQTLDEWIHAARLEAESVKVRQDLVLDVSKSGSICLRLNKT